VFSLRSHWPPNRAKKGNRDFLPEAVFVSMSDSLSDVLFMAGDVPVTLAVALLACAGAAVLLLLVLAIAVMTSSRRWQMSALEQGLRAGELEERIGDMARSQAETAGRVQAMGEALAGRQAELARAMSEQLNSVTHRVGVSMEETTRHTQESLRKLHERLAVIDSAHKNLSDLTAQVTTLRDVLANKQARGAFGQARMEAIVQDGMPKGAYEFQYTLSTGKRPDCVIFLPDQRPLVIDAKFPLESVTALRDARSDDERRAAGQRLRQDIGKHIADIADKYLIAGETQEMALMFVPSESVYAEIYDGFDDLIQKAYRARIVLVSPSLLMLAIQVMQQIMKDARMREAADQIQSEVVMMMDDVARLRDRVANLGKHFSQVGEDVRQVLISADKIEKRATRIEELDFGEAPETAQRVLPIRPHLQAGE